MNIASPSIYVACLAAYNNGWLHGKWIDCTASYHDVCGEIQSMLRDSPVTKEFGEIGGEWTIHDSQNWGHFQVEESADIEELCEVADVLKNGRDHYDSELIVAIMNDFKYSVDKSVSYLENFYIGEYNSAQDYADKVLGESGAFDRIPWLRGYFDYEGYARDLEINSLTTYDAPNRRVYILHNN